MGLSKEQVERHISCVKQRLSTEKEHNLHGFEFAKLCFKVKSYEDAIRYLSGYLSEKECDYRAHKLMGHACEAVGLVSKAILHYRRSMEIKEQKELVMTVAQLYCQRDDIPLSDLKDILLKLQSSSIDHPLVLQLNEKIRLQQGSSPFTDSPNPMETFSSSDLDRHIQFVKYYCISGKLSQAFEYCQLVSCKGYFSDSIHWHTCALETAEKYYLHLKSSTCADAEKSLEVLVALLEALCCLFHLTADINKECLPKCSIYLMKYDKVLFAALNSLKSIPSSVYSHYQVPVQDLCGQLYFMAACYLFLMGHSAGNIDSVNSSYFQLGELCLLASLQATPPALEVAWSQSFASKSFVEQWCKAACARLSIVGRLLRIIASSKGILHLKELPMYIDSKGGKLLLIRMLFGENNVSTSSKPEMLYSLQESFLAKDNLVDLAFELPLLEDLALCDQVYVKQIGLNFRGLVWLYLSYKALDMDPPATEWLKEIFVGLKINAPDLTRSDPDTLSLYDIEAFLVLLVHEHQTTITTKSYTSQSTTNQPLNLAMCSFLPCCIRMDSGSLDWLINVNKMLDSNLSAREGIQVKKAIRSNLSIIRGCRPLQLHIEQLTVLARHFKTKAEKIVKSPDSQGLNYRSSVSMLLKRSSHYWTIICNIPIEAYQQKWAGRKPLKPSDISSDKSILSEARMTLANVALYENDISTALEFYSMVKTPQAAWNQSQIFLLKAKHGDTESLEGVNIRSTNLKKALEMTTLALDRLSPTDDLKIRDKLLTQLEEVKQMTESESSSVVRSLDYDVSMTVPHHSTPSRDKNVSFQYGNDQCTPHSVSTFSLTETLKESLKKKEEELLSMKNHLQQIQAEMEEIKEKQLLFEGSPVQAQPLQSTGSFYSPQQVCGGNVLDKSLSLESQYSPQYTTTTTSTVTSFYTAPVQTTSSILSDTNGSVVKPLITSTNSFVSVMGYVAGDQHTLAPLQSPAFSGGKTQSSCTVNEPFQFVPQSSNSSTKAKLPTTAYTFPSTVQSTTFQSTAKLGFPSFSLGKHLSTCVASNSAPAISVTTSVTLPPFSGIYNSNLPTLTAATMSISPLTFTSLPQSIFNVSVSQTPGTVGSNVFQPGISFNFASQGTFSSTNALTSVPLMLPKFPLLSSLLSNSSVQSTSSEIPFSSSTCTSTATSEMPFVELFPSIATCTSSSTVDRDSDSTMKHSLFDSGAAIDDNLDTSGELETAPIVSLPLLEDIKSGEEDETVLFCCRAKLYRYDNSQWKERGVGDMKILQHQKSSKVRLLMRREQVLKLCCNHYITPDMSLTPFGRGASAWAWYTPHDFAEGISKPETLAIKFKRPESSESFRQIIEKCIDEADDADRSVTVSTDASSSLLSQFAPKQGSWNCDECYVVNDPSALSCVACKRKKLDSCITTTAVPNSLMQSSEPVYKNWTCNQCYVENDGSDDQCAACEANKPSGNGEKPTTSNLSTQILENTGHLLKSNTGPSALLAKPQIGASGGLKIEGLDSLHKFAPMSSTKQEYGILQHGLRIECPTQPSMTEFREEKTVEDSEKLVMSGESEMTTPESSALKPSPSDTPFTFTLKDRPLSFAFSSPVHNPFSSQCIEQKGPSVEPATTLALGTTREIDAHTQPVSKSCTVSSTATSHVSLDSTQHQPSENLTETEPKLDFKPLVTLEEAELITGEENEDILFSHRAKLYRFDVSVQQWKEKGIGDIKILKHKQYNKVRVLMRREQVLKICCNHYLLPHMTLAPLMNSDKAWVWYTSGEYADQTCQAEKLAVKFKEKDIAQNFKTVFDSCVHSLSSDLPTYPSPHSLDQIQDSDCEHDTSDVEIVQVEIPTREKVELARKFMLPETFYNYEKKAPCPGCRGCFEDEQLDIQQPNVSTEFSIKPHHRLTPEHDNLPSSYGHSIDSCAKPAIFGTTGPSSLSFADIAASSSEIPFQFDPSIGFQGAGDALFKSSTDNVQDEADVHFDPLVTLPEVQLNTGEENEVVLFSNRAKLYRFTSAVWKERGVGDIKILANKSSHKARILMRREQVLKICCNHAITAEMTLVPNQGSDKSWTWYTPCDFADEVSKPEKFAVRFKHSDSAKKFKEVFDTCVFNCTKTSSGHQGKMFHTSESLVEKFSSPHSSWCCDACYVMNPVQKETCSACGAKRPNVDSKHAQNVTPNTESSSVNDHAMLSVYSPSLSIDTSPSSFESAIPSLAEKKSDIQDEEVNRILANEEEVFSGIAELSYQDCKVKDWVFKGCGTMKILKNVMTGSQRVLMTQNDSNTTVLCSHPITSLMRLRNVTGHDLSWVWNGYEGDLTSGETQFLRYLIKFNDQVLAEKFKQNFKASQSLLHFTQVSSQNQSLSEDELEDSLSISPVISTSFTENKGDSSDNEVIFLFEEVSDPELIEKAAKFMLPKSFYLYEKKTPCPGCRGCINEHDGDGVTLPLPTAQTDEPDTLCDTSAEIDDSSSCAKVSDSQEVSKHFSSTSMLSFSDIVSRAENTSVPFGKDSGFKFQGAGTQLFPSPSAKQEEDAENPEVEADIKFEPIISLPEAISFKSWDDEADTLFVHRAKLFRYDSKTSQWKERGLGDLKILRHRVTKRVRLIMRRDQILKICCNHYITEGMELLPGTNEKSWIWFTASDFSDDEPKAEKLAVRFKHVEVAREFQKIFTRCVAESQQQVPKLTGLTQESLLDQPALAQCDKSWECRVCYVKNDSEQRYCCACQSPNDTLNPDMVEHRQVTSDDNEAQ